MEFISKEQAIKILRQKKVTFFWHCWYWQNFWNKKEKTFYELLQRLQRAGLIERIIKGKYYFPFREFNDFELANFLIAPSYISLESALSFYGTLPQFPYTVTSVTTLKPKKIGFRDKEYEFSHLDRKYFFGFLKKDKFLIATPEKAPLDELYYASKKTRTIHFADLDLKSIDKKKFKILSKKYKFLPLQNLLKKLKLI